MRNLARAIRNAIRLREEIPQLVQPEKASFYQVILAEEVARLRGMIISMGADPDRPTVDQLEKLMLLPELANYLEQHELRDRWLFRTTTNYALDVAEAEQEQRRNSGTPDRVESAGENGGG